MGNGIVKYQASDGTDVTLSPGIVARYIATGNDQVSERDAYRFIAVCQARHLNPLAGDAYMSIFKSRDGKTTTPTVIVSKDYYMRTATQQPGYDGLKAGVIVKDKASGQLIYREGTIVDKDVEALVGGWCDVFDKNRSHPSRAEVSLGEYNTHRNLWDSKPATMIRKVALVQALREAYPGAYGGVYDSSELDPNEPPEQPIPVEVTPVVEAAPADYAQAGETADGFDFGEGA